MKITRLDIKSFMKIKTAEIEPDGSLVVIGGVNGSGKTSVLSAIDAILGGKKRIPRDPIRHGDDKSNIVMETDEFVARLTITEKGEYLKVDAKDGSRITSPQQLFDEITSPISFDPLEFERMPPKKQAETLRKLVGLDFTAENEKRKEAYDKRTEVGREIKRLQGAISKLPPRAKVPDEEVSVAELTKEIDRRREVNAANAEQRQMLDGLRSTAKSLLEEIKRTEEKLAKLREEFKVTSDEGKRLAGEVKTLVDEDLDEIREKIATAEQTNAAVRSMKERRRLETELKEQMAESDRLTNYIHQIDEVKADATANAKYPIKGLAATDDGVTFDEVPFEQASHGQRLRVSTAIGLAMNPKLNVLRIRDGSRLDEEGLKIMAQMAEEHDAQIWLERVSDDGAGCSIVICDGEIVDD
jgi:recombinational DNA repair ATPase RecF